MCWLQQLGRAAEKGILRHLSIAVLRKKARENVKCTCLDKKTDSWS